MNMISANMEKKASDVLRETGAFRVPVPVDLVAMRLGLESEAADLGNDISGVLVVNGNRGSIGYNRQHVPVRQRFTIAHETGHYVLHRNEPESANLYIDKKFSVFLRDTESSEGANRREIEANAFAAALLMPKELLVKEIECDELDLADEDALETLAAKFEVSTQAMSFRLAKLGLI